LVTLCCGFGSIFGVSFVVVVGVILMCDMFGL
jgi:hypothetical protein